MIKKTSKLLLLAVATFFLAMVPTFAKQMSYEELEQTILEYEPDAESAYIIGKYVFTSAHTLKPQDYMLAAGTISATTADGKTNQDAIFGKMTIHFLDGEFNGDGETTGFAIQENKVGTTEITEDSTFNISYIDYQLLSEPTEFSVSVDIGDVFSDSDYYSSGNHSSLSLSPDGVLTGLIEKHANLDSWYPAETKSPGSYYFIYKLEVPGETEETVIKTTLINGEKKVQGHVEGGVHYLILAADPAVGTHTITVDLDGDGDEYDATSYTIDYSGADFQQYSSIHFSEELLSSHGDKLFSFGYQTEKTYQVENDDQDSYKVYVQGKVSRQDVNESAFGEMNKNGHFFALLLTADEMSNQTKITLKDEKTKLITTDNEALILRAAVDENSKTFTITVDLDGEEAYYLPVEYTIDYSKLILQESSKSNIENKLTGTNSEGKIPTLEDIFGEKSSYHWQPKEGFDLQVAMSGNRATITGLLPIVEDVTGFPEEELTGYYLPLVIQTLIDATDETVVTVPCKSCVNGVKNVGKDSFDTKQEIALIMSIDPDTPVENRQFEVVVDMDGEGEDYAPYTITIDYSALKLQTTSSAKFGKDFTEEVREALRKWNYEKQLDYSVEVDPENDHKILVSGIVANQELTNVPFGETYKQGHFFVFTLDLDEVPDDIEVTINQGSLGDVPKKHKEDFDGNQLILLRRAEGTETADNGSHDGNYPTSFEITVDLDGPNKYEYLPVTYTVDYSQLQLLKSSDTVVSNEFSGSEKTVENVLKESSFHWTKPEHYSVSISQVADKATVTGLLPMIETKQDGFGENLQTHYYLPIVIKTKVAPTENTEVIIPCKSCDGGTRMIVGKDSFDTTNEMVIFLALDPTTPVENRSFEIVVNMDGELEEYAPFDITVDWSQLVLQEKSEVTIDTTVPTESIESMKTDYHYEKNAKDEINIVDGKLTGKIYENNEVTAFGGSDKTGFYFAFTIHPEVLSDDMKVTVQGKNTKTFTRKDFDEEGLTILFSLDEDKIKNCQEHSSDDCKITITTDLDGDNHYDYLPSTETIDYSKIEFVHAHVITYQYPTGDVTEQIYEDEILTQPEEDPEGNDYHTFLYWMESDEENEYEFNTSVSEDKTLVPHWELEVDRFIEDVVQNGNTYDDFTVSKDGKEITFNLLNTKIAISELWETNLPGAIAYVLEKGEVTAIDLIYNNDETHVAHFDTADNKEAVIQEMQKMLYEVLSNNESSIVDELLNDTLTIKVVTLKNTAEVQEEEKEYTIDFEADYTYAQDEQQLLAALKDDKYSKVILEKDFEISKPIVITEDEIIDGRGNKLTYRGESTDAVITVSSGKSEVFDVEIENSPTVQRVATVNGIKYAIKVLKGATVEVHDIELTGDYEAGVQVEDGGTFIASSVTFANESYDVPTVRATKSKNSKVELTLTDDKKAPSTPYEEIKTYEKIIEEQPDYANGRFTIGDEKVEKANYNYTHYYLNDKFSNRWAKITYIGNRGLAGMPLYFVRYDDRTSEEEHAPEPPADYQYLTTYETASAKYTLSAWAQGETQYPTGSVPKANYDTSYVAVLAAQYKDHVTSVKTETQLKEALQNNQYTTIIIDAEIDLEEPLTISRDNVLLTGTVPGSGKITGILKGEIIVTGTNVSFSSMKVIGKKVNVVDGRHDVVKIEGEFFRSSQVVYSAEALSNGQKWDSILYYTHDKPRTVLFYNIFNGNHLKTFVEFEGDVDGTVPDEDEDGTSIVGNEFDDQNNAMTFIQMKKATGIINIQITTSIINNSDTYFIKLDAESQANKLELYASNFWVKGSMATAKFGINVGDDPDADASGITISYLGSSTTREKIDVHYLNQTGADVTEQRTSEKNVKFTER